MTAIEVEDVSVFAGDLCLLGPVSFKVERGETLVIMGETGAGKSLIAQTILGTLPDGLRCEGRISINGQRVDALDYQARARLWGRQITTLPQEPWRALGPLMAAWRQVDETHRHVGGLARAEAKQQTVRDLVTLGLDGGEARLPGALSGGMAQRVAFAAATAGRAPILLADEPTKGLDSERQARVIELLSQVSDHGGTLLAITHEGTVAQALGGRLIVLREGKVVEQGDTKAVLADPQAAYTQDLLAADPNRWPKATPATHGDVELRGRGLSVGRGNRVLIEGFDVSLHRGERIAISGPSGVGKTTLLDVLAGLIAPMKGRVERSAQLSRYAVQKLYQDPPAAFPPHIPLGQNLRDVARLHGVAWKQVLNHLSDLKLSPILLDRSPHEVSGGELQRLSITRALIANPRVLLADEPTSRLDPITQRDTLELIRDIAAKRSIAVVLVTHNANIAEKWADRSVTLGTG